MKKYGQMAFAFTILAVFLSYVDVKAEVKQFNVCADNALYSIIYDTSINNQVTEEKIYTDSSALQNGYVDGINDTAHKFTSTSTGAKCFIEGGQIKKCPTSSKLEMTKVNETYINNETLGVTSNIDISFNEGNGTFNVSIKDKFDGQMKIRYVYGSMSSNVGNSLEVKDASAYPANEFLSKNGNTYNIYGVGSNQPIKLEFYLNTNDVCNDTFLGHIVFYTPNADDYMIANPAKSNPGAYGCDTVKNYKPNGMPNKTDELDNLNKTKREVVNYCYMDKIKYGEKYRLGSIISQQYNALQQLYSIYKAPTRDSSKGTCDSPVEQHKSSTVSETGSYWAIRCDEVYTATGDKPKLVKAGGGFAYESVFTVEKTCKIVQIYQPSKKPQCVVSTSCDCQWVAPKTGNVYKDDVGGPDDTFDNCVYKCDNGKYTQKCINSCYKETSNRKRDLSFIDEIVSRIKDDSNIKQQSACNVGSGNIKTGDYKASEIGTIVGHRNTWNNVDVPTSYRYNPANVYEYNGTQCTQSNWCTNNGFGCTFHVSVGPDGCSWDPECEYAAELSSSASELASFEDKAKAAVELGNAIYTYTITDSYYNNGNYQFVVNSKDNPALQVTRSNEDTGSSTNTTALGASGGQTVTYTSSASRKATVTVRLPYSYVNKLTSDATYKSNENTSTRGYIIDPSRTSLVQEPKNDKIKYNTGYYHEPGERKYYTSIYSPNINVNITDNDITLKEPSDFTAWNIKVQSSGLGNGNFGSVINCYYGVYNQFRKCTGPDCPKDVCDPKTEVCDGNIQYIFRPIELSDVFPNDRGPRFNWSCRANLQEWYRQNVYKTDVAPVLLTKEIQTKGESIYDNPSELDYEFTLTGSNIRAIKEYNDSVADFNKDGNKNYLDYDVTNCKDSGCECSFLNDNKYVTFTKRGKELVGCNNGINGECDTSINLSSRDMCRGSYGNVQSPPDSDCSQAIYPVE